MNENCDHKPDQQECSWCRPERTFNKPAVRIDTLRNRIIACRELLKIAGIELEDLHVLAYERQTAAQLERVDGGSRDYALDTHGDKRARNAYRDLGDAVVEVVERLAEPAHAARRILRDGDDRHPQPRRIQLTDLASAIEAQQRRLDRGEGYTPRRALAQPDNDTALSEAVKEAEKLRRENARLQRFGRWAWEHRKDDGKKKDALPNDLIVVLDALYPERKSNVPA